MAAPNSTLQRYFLRTLTYIPLDDAEIGVQ
jgi:hypothetical protein